MQEEEKLLGLTIVAVGKQKEKWQREGTAEYLKRLEGFCRPSVIEISEYRLPENPSPAEICRGLEAEGRDILQKLGKTPFAALCVEGRQLDSPQLADWICAQQQTTGTLAFVIGGSFGLSDEVKGRAALRLSLSRMTFPHQLFRMMLAEQLYRAFSIANGGKYHK